MIECRGIPKMGVIRNDYSWQPYNLPVRTKTQSANINIKFPANGNNAYDLAWWKWCSPDSIDIRWKYVQPAAMISGAVGQYLFGLPPGFELDAQATQFRKLDILHNNSAPIILGPAFWSDSASTNDGFLSIPQYTDTPDRRWLQASIKTGAAGGTPWTAADAINFTSTNLFISFYATGIPVLQFGNI